MGEVGKREVERGRKKEGWEVARSGRKRKGRREKQEAEKRAVNVAELLQRAPISCCRISRG